MAGEGDAERLVVLLEARIRDFEKNMQKASKTARSQFDRINKDAERSAAKLETTFAGAAARLSAKGSKFGVDFFKGFAAGAAGAIAGAFNVTAIRDAIGSVGDLSDLSDRIGLTAEKIQELRYAAEVNGGSIEAVDEGLQKFSKNISDAGRGTGDLLAVLRANNVALRDASGNLRPTSDLLGDYADLVANATNQQDKLNLATIAAGRSAGPQLVGMLSKGKQGLAEWAMQGREAGVVIGDDLVSAGGALNDKLTALEHQLRTTFGEFAVSTGPAMVSGLESINGLLADIEATLNSWPMQKMDELLTWAEKMNAAAGAATGDFLGTRQAGQDLFHRLGKADTLDALSEQIAKSQAHLDELKADLADPARASMLGHTKLQLDISDAQKQLDDLNARADALRAKLGMPAADSGGAAAPDAVPAPKPTPTVVPKVGGGSGESSRDREAERVQRQREQVDEYIASLEEERRLVGATDEERAVSNNLRLAGADATDAQRQKIEDLTRSLVQEQEQWAGLEEASQFFGDQLYSAIDGLLIQGDSLNDVFANLAKTIAEAALQAALLGQGPLAGLLGGGSGGGGAGGIIGAILSAVAGGGRAVGGTGGLYANGAAFAGGNVLPFANGGVVTRPTLFPMANGTGLMGEAGPEAVMPLRRGRDGKLGVAASAAPINVTINNMASNEVEIHTRSERGPDGEKLIMDVVRRAVARGDLDAAQRGRYGLSRQKVRG